jgi:hypothetical protein
MLYIAVVRYHRNIAIGSYFVLSAVWVYWILDRQVFFGNPDGDWAVLGFVVLVHVGLGFAVNRWWSLLLPFYFVVIGIPVGYPSTNRGEPLPIWFGLLLAWPAAVALIAIGLGLRKVVERRRAVAT